MEPSRKNLFGVWGTPAAQSLGGEAFKSTRSILLNSLATTCLPLREVCWLLACLAPSNFWGNGVGIRSDLGRNSNLPCLGSYFCTICLAWLACLGYLAGFYLWILRLPVGPLLGGHFPGSLQILCGAGDISGTAYFSFNYFGFSGLSYT